MSRPAAPSRRAFLKSATTAAAAPAVALSGCAGDTPPPPRLNLALRSGTPAHPDDEAIVVIDGRSYRLRPQDDASLAQWAQEQPAAAASPRALLPTHFLEGVALPRDSAMRIHATVRKAGRPANERRLALVHISVPAARLPDELARVIALRTGMGLTSARSGSGRPGPELLVARYAESPTPVSTAVALAYHHPELMSFNGEAATTVVAHIHASPYLMELWSEIANRPGTDGDDASWCLAVPVTDDATGVPLIDDDGGIVYDYQPMPDILDLVGMVVRDVLLSVKNDGALEDILWSSSEGVPNRPVDAPLTAGAVGAAGGYRLSPAIANGRRTNGVSFEAKVVDAARRRIEVSMRNDQLRFQGVHVCFRDARGERLPLGDAALISVVTDMIEQMPAVAPFLDNFLAVLKADTKVIGLLQPTATFLGFPVRDGRGVTSFEMPAAAVSAELVLGSTGLGVLRGDARETQEELIGFLLTMVVGYAVPTVTLMLAGGATTNQKLLDVIKKEPGIWVDILSTVHGLYPGLFKGDWRSLENAGTRLLINLADRMVKLVLNGGFTLLWKWLLTEIIFQNAVKAIPFLGWAMRVATVAGNIQLITRTTIDSLSNPPRLTNTLSLSADIDLTINRDLDGFTFPATATHYEVQLTIGGATGYTSGVRPVPRVGQSEPIRLTIPDVPSGGTGTVTVSFRGPNGLISGKGNAAVYAPTSASLQALTVGTERFEKVPPEVVTRLQPMAGRSYAGTPELVADLLALLGTALSERWRKNIAARLAIVDIPLLLNGASTLALECTIEEQLVPLTAATRYAHQRVLQYAGGRYLWQDTPLPRPATPPTCDSSANALCELGGITLAQRSGQIGYAWRASSAGLPVCGSGASGTQAWTVQNISLQDDPNGALRALRLGGVRCGIVEGAGIVYQFDGPSDGSGANFLLDGRGGLIQVRPIDNASPDSLELSGMTRSHGTFSSLPTSVAWHFAGYLIGVNAATHKIEIVDLNNPPVPDAEAPLPKVGAGLGTRAGLLRGPVCVAATLDGRVLVLESLAGQVQAFDVDASPVSCFAGARASFALRPRGQTVRYLDMGIDATGHVFVLVQAGDGTQVSHFNLDIYTPDGAFLCSTNGFSAARMAVDLWRNVYSLNWETLQGRDGRTEPTVSRWVPN